MKTEGAVSDRRCPFCAPRQGCEESATPFQGADSRVVKTFQGYAKNAYPWLISQHRSAVRNVQTQNPGFSQAKARVCVFYSPAWSFSLPALSVFSQLNSGSFRPKW